MCFRFAVTECKRGVSPGKPLQGLSLNQWADCPRRRAKRSFRQPWRVAKVQPKLCNIGRFEFSLHCGICGDCASQQFSWARWYVGLDSALDTVSGGRAHVDDKQRHGHGRWCGRWWWAGVYDVCLGESSKSMVISTYSDLFCSCA